MDRVSGARLRRLELQKQSTRGLFALLLVACWLLLIRPGDLIPGMADVPLYQLTLLLMLLPGLKAIQPLWNRHSLKEAPTTVCVLGFAIAIPLSDLSQLSLGASVVDVQLSIKLLFLFLLVQAVVVDEDRLRRLLAGIAIAGTIMVALCVGDTLQVFEIQSITPYVDWDGTDQLNRKAQIQRMRGPGIFQDPNDLGSLMALLGVLSVGLAFRTRSMGRRILWLLPLVVLIPGLQLTHSRGALLAVGAALGTVALWKFGRTAAIALGCCCLPILPLLAGRSGGFEMSEGTGQERIQLWREGFGAFLSPHMPFGTGHGTYGDIAGLAAHNSFLHAFVELGLFGGFSFLGCFLLPGLGLYRLARVRTIDPDPALSHWGPVVAAALAAWSASMMSLSRCYVEPTLLVAAIAAAYLQLIHIRYPRLPLVVWDKRHVRILLLVGFALLAGLYALVRVLAS